MKIFHHDDEDGRLSAFLLIRALRSYLKPEDVIEINYETPFPVDKINYGEVVFVVDFSFTEAKTIAEIREIAFLVWIDHHEDFLKLKESHPWTKDIHGLRRNNFFDEKEGFALSGAALTYIWMKYARLDPIVNHFGGYNTEEKVKQYLSNNCTKNMDFIDSMFSLSYNTRDPHVTLDVFEMIRYISDYDTHSLCHSDIDEFFYGIRDMEQNPYGENAWVRKIDYIIEHGKITKKVRENEMKEYLMRNGLILEFNGLNILAVNRETNSHIFDSFLDSEERNKEFPLRMVFVTKNNIFYKVTFYSSDESEVKAYDLAVRFKGGGHPGAAGCTIPIDLFTEKFNFVGSIKDYLKGGC